MHDLNPVVVYSAALVIPVTAPVIPDGAVAVYLNRVVHVGTRSWVLKALNEGPLRSKRIVEKHWDGVLLPGLVNAHTHLQYTGMASVGEKNYNSFQEWSDAFDEIYDDDSIEKPWKEWAYDGARQLVKYGTTAAADITTDLEAAGALYSQRMHGITYLEVMGWENDNWHASGPEWLRDLLAQASQEDEAAEIGISPHAPYSLDSAPLLDLPDIARSLGMRLHIHLGETPSESASEIDGDDSHANDLYSPVSRSWRSHHWDSYPQLKSSGEHVSSIQFVDQLGSLGPDIHIAHGVYANAEDRRILRQRGVGVALCPRSNRITCTQKDAPVAQYLREGNLVSVGTDSLSSSPSLDVLDDVSMLYDLAREQGYTGHDLSHRLIRMMTLGGAEVMGLNIGPKRIGQINAGALADFAFLDVPVDLSSNEAYEHTLERIVREGSGTNRATVISGRVAYNNDAFEMED
ncbi:cytosine deaminase [Alloscardovia theropitheci]|uniref:Cytosine deaminase n=1 Tax=Alloscardovia theropitheci TaxID=2496842 RepID=A0A4R0QTQ9_9BIFI|nr:amidohydrolase family protein [Alloscardovia theropitheci]TCD54928.1 cytosine deaminase [Alloscardovia theropitheci]